MSESSESQSDILLEASIPEAGASLESILCTEELQGRPSRPPDYEKENCALVALMSALADSPSTIFQTLAETILDITYCDSAGLSLLTRDGKKPDVCGKRFYWPAIAGMWNPHVGGGTPRNFGPCGDVLDQNRTLLFRHFERRYPYLMPVIPAAEECLLVPFYVAGQAVGTIWAIMHSDRRKFDAEDDRVMASLGKFASSAYQALVHIEDFKFQVAEREKAEAAARELANGLEAKFRCLVDANIMGIIFWNLEGEIVEANEAFLHIVEYNREDLVSGCIRWTDLTPPEWRDRDERAVAELKALGVAKPYEKEYLQKGGNRVPVLVGGALFEEGGNEGVAFVLDLSEQKRAQEERKRAEQALRRSEAYLAEAQRLTLTGSCAIDGTSRETVYWSEEMFRLFGFDPQQGLPMWDQWLQRVHPEDRDKVKLAGDRTFLKRVDCDVEFRLVKPDGTVKHIHGIGHPVLSPNGELVQVVGTMVDITERRRAEEALRRSESYLVQAQRLAHVGSWAWEIPSRNALYISEEWYRIYGFDPKDGMPSWEQRLHRVHPEDRAIFQATIDRAIAEKSDYDVEFRFLPPHVQGRHIHSVGHPILGPSGELVQFVGVSMDVTERKQAEEERERLRRAQAELARINRVSTMGELAASIAHEVNQPLTAITNNGSACLRLLSNSSLDPEILQRALEEIVADSTRASAVISRIRAFIKKMPDEKSILNINEVIQEVLALAGHEIQKNQILVECQLAKTSTLVLADRVQLQQVLLNLIMNGTEAMTAVTDRPRVLWVQSQIDESGHVLVAVQDSGTGLGSDADRVFTPFFTTKADGMGMGLPISRSLIEAHGGRLWAEPNFPQGTVVSFTLPAANGSTS